MVKAAGWRPHWSILQRRKRLAAPLEKLPLFVHKDLLPEKAFYFLFFFSSLAGSQKTPTGLISDSSMNPRKQASSAGQQPPCKSPDWAVMVCGGCGVPGGAFFSALSLARIPTLSALQSGARLETEGCRPAQEGLVPVQGTLSKKPNPLFW